MTPYILMEPELLHLFSCDEERNSLFMELVEVLQAVVQSECKLETKNTKPDPYGIKNITPANMDSLCERITPKLTSVSELFWSNSKYPDKISVELKVSRHKLHLYLAPKYYTGLSSSIH